MDKKIVFFDIDGTLVDEKSHDIPESTRKAIRELRANGHLAFINTGRPLSEISELHKSIEFDGFILGCGTNIDYNGEALLYKSLGKKLTKQITDDIILHKIDGVLEGRYGVYFDNLENIKSKEVHYAIKVHKHEGIYKGLTWYEDNIDADKLVIFINEESDFEGFHNKYKDTFEFIHRNDNFYELVPLGYSKASGIEFIINYLGIPFENTYAIGDSTNDLSMLKYVKHSIAMGNSTPALFDLVEYITTDIDKDGIFNALKHYKLI